MPRPRSLDHTSIAGAALTVVDREGLSALSMRSLAAELGIGTMSLYRYVTGREEVERLIVDRIFLAADPDTVAHDSWQEQVRGLSELMRSAIADHAAVIPLLLVHFQFSPSAWRWLNALLKAFTQAGFSAQQRVIAVRTLQAYVIGAAQDEVLVPLDGAGTNALSDLPTDDYPLVVETALAALSMPPGQEFQSGLRVILEGLATGFAREEGGHDG